MRFSSNGCCNLILCPSLGPGGQLLLHGLLHHLIHIFPRILSHLLTHSLHPSGHALRIVLVQTAPLRWVRQALHSALLRTNHPDPREDTRHLFAFTSFALRRKGFLTLHQEKFRDLPTIVTTILVNWHIDFLSFENASWATRQRTRSRAMTFRAAISRFGLF